MIKASPAKRHALQDGDILANPNARSDHNAEGMRCIETRPKARLSVDIAREADAGAIPEDSSQDRTGKRDGADLALEAQPEHKLESRGQEKEPQPKHPAWLAGRAEPRQENVHVPGQRHDRAPGMMMRAGAPTATAPAGTSRSTTLLAPTFDPDPTWIAPSTTAPAPIST